MLRVWVLPKLRVFRFVGRWAGRAQNRKTRNSNGPEASSESSDFRLCFPAEGAARLGRARGLWTEGGAGGGWREGLGDWWEADLPLQIAP